MIKDGFNIPTIEDAKIEHKKVLIRVDYNIALEDGVVANDTRITQSLPTLQQLLKHKNKLILMAHLGRPEGRDPKFSLGVVAKDLQKYLPEYNIVLINDFQSQEGKKQLDSQTEKDVMLLENLRYYPGEKANDPKFTKELASLGEIFVNDAFGVSHRKSATVIGLPHYLPSYAGLLLAREVTMIAKVIKNPKKPMVAIIGGAKISTKLPILGKLLELADDLILGGGLANTFFCAEGFNIGKSYCELEEVDNAKQLLFMAAQKNTAVVLPLDVVVGNSKNTKHAGKVYKVNEIPAGGEALDIGPETKAKFGAIIAKAKTIVWNGPMGLFENPVYRQGTDFIYHAIAQNSHAVSIVGGGDTLNAIQHKHHLDKITHISTGGGAMLEFIENGTLPGLEALKKK